MNTTVHPTDPIHHPWYYITTINMEGYEYTHEMRGSSGNVSLIAHRDQVMLEWDKIVSQVGVNYLHAFLYVQSHFTYKSEEKHLLASI